MWTRLHVGAKSWSELKPAHDDLLTFRCDSYANKWKGQLGSLPGKSKIKGQLNCHADADLEEATGGSCRLLLTQPKTGRCVRRDH